MFGEGGGRAQSDDRGGTPARHRASQRTGGPWQVSFRKRRCLFLRTSRGGCERLHQRLMANLHLCSPPCCPTQRPSIRLLPRPAQFFSTRQLLWKEWLCSSMGWGTSWGDVVFQVTKASPGPRFFAAPAIHRTKPTNGAIPWIGNAPAGGIEAHVVAAPNHGPVSLE